MANLTYIKQDNVASLRNAFDLIVAAITATFGWQIADDDASASYISKVFYSPGRNQGEDIYIKIDWLPDTLELRFWACESWDSGLNVGANVIGGLSFADPSPTEPCTVFVIVNLERLVFCRKLPGYYDIAYAGSLFGFGTQSDIFWPTCIINFGYTTSWAQPRFGKILRIPDESGGTFLVTNNANVECILADYPKVADPSSWSERYVASHIPVVGADCIAGILSEVIYVSNAGIESILSVGPYEFITFPIGGSTTAVDLIGVRID